MMLYENTRTVYDLVHNASAEHGDRVFLQYEENGEVRVKKDLINKALFMSVSVVLANDKYQNMNLDMCRERAIKTLAVQLQDKKFDKSISGGTGDRSNVLLNFEIIQEVIDRCVTEE